MHRAHDVCRCSQFHGISLADSGQVTRCVFRVTERSVRKFDGPPSVKDNNVAAVTHVILQMQRSSIQVSIKLGDIKNPIL